MRNVKMTREARNIIADIVRLIITIDDLKQEILRLKHKKTAAELEKLSDTIDLIKKNIGQNKCLLNYLITTFPYGRETFKTYESLKDAICYKFIEFTLSNEKRPEWFLATQERYFKILTKYPYKNHELGYYPQKGQEWLGLPKDLSQRSKIIAQQILPRDLEYEACFDSYDQRINERIDELEDGPEKTALKALQEPEWDNDVYLYIADLKLDNQPNITSEKSKKIIADLKRDLAVIESNITLAQYAQYQEILVRSIATIQGHINKLAFFKFMNNQVLVDGKIAEFKKLIKAIEAANNIENIGTISDFIDRLPTWIKNGNILASHRNGNKAELTYSETIVRDLERDLRDAANDGSLTQYYQCQANLAPIVRMITLQLRWWYFCSCFSVFISRWHSQLLRTKHSAFTELLSAINRIDIDKSHESINATLTRWKDTHGNIIKEHRFASEETNSETQSTMIVNELDKALGISPAFTIN
jgi:hypothetical protein